MRGHLGSYFEAAWADSGSNGDDQILRLSPEMSCHCFHGPRSDFRHNPAPSSVDGGYRVISGIRDQNRKTIGRSDRQSYPWLIGDQCVALALRAVRFHHQNAVGVNLLGCGQAAVRRPAVTQAGAKSMLEPRQAGERVRPINVVTVAPEQNTIVTRPCWFTVV